MPQRALGEVHGRFAGVIWVSAGRRGRGSFPVLRRKPEFGCASQRGASR
ncbi:hypothetical protein HMPREF9440_02372 [Sutterella parvirubra YIT 11816]|uniref:Uncharacterized protein n=1 Tax=Sutterella parvirubra YIT 11816 TaxID=762967 RepID=H3KHX4_9BURK|nr:hypothetical protein HMPREF9440_02372 [Sutterella parvirubra YIT 11816]